MSDLDSSAKRFDAAMTRLEAAVEKRGERIAVAESDRKRVERELAALRADLARMRKASSGVSARLDTVIGRLKTALGDDA